MNKFAVFSGFLGSGKTTTMMALAKHCTHRHAKTAIISNDLGNLSLADNKLARLSGCNASELLGDCICYQTENLVARLDKCFGQEACRLVISDIPGFGVGALEHVYHTLHTAFRDRYQLAPFTVLVEPGTVERLRRGGGEDLRYILHAQLLEADLIVLNKCDMLNEERKLSNIAWLRGEYPEARVIGISALTGEGLEELASHLLEGNASLRRPDIGYGGEAFRAAMGKMSEYYIQYHAAVCCNDFSGNDYLMTLGERVRQAFLDAGAEIPHLKLLAWTPEGDYGKTDVLGVCRPVEMSRGFSGPCTQLAVMLNASAVCPGEKLDKLITGCADQVSREYGLEMTVFKKECFGIGV